MRGEGAAITRPRVVVTMGDPGGIGPEICVLGLTDAAISGRVSPVIVGDRARLEEALGVLVRAGRLPSPPPTVRAVTDPGETRARPGEVCVIDLANVHALPWGTLSAAAGRASFAYLQRAVELVRQNRADAVCTAPINKAAWHMAGVPYPGHTEALAALTATSTYAMMLVNERLRVIHVSTHVGLRRALEMLSVDRVRRTILLAAEALSRYVTVAPRLALAGLNPHAGEGGLFGAEEASILRPAVEEAVRRGARVSGPLPPDTVFARAAAGEFDGVVALYHDQGHIAVKMLGLDTGVNVTIGLPFLRTSVDHGTAFDIAGQGKAREGSMIAALATAAAFLAAAQAPGSR